MLSQRWSPCVALSAAHILLRSCLTDTAACRCEYVDDEMGNSNLEWKLSDCVADGAWCTDLDGTPFCEPSADGASAACSCDM